MKSLLFFLALLFTIILSVSSVPVTAKSADTSNKERAPTTFSQPVHLLGMTLKASTYSSMTMRL